MKIAKYPLPKNEIISRFQETIHDLDLKYTTADLFKAGIESQKDLNQAMLKTVHALHKSEIEITRYLKRIYITDIESGETHIDWKMNKLTFFFVILNSESQNATILQWKQKILEVLME